MNRNNNRIRVTETIKTKIEICLRCSQEKCKCLKAKSWGELQNDYSTHKP